jgi:hypothetical protein
MIRFIRPSLDMNVHNLKNEMRQLKKMLQFARSRKLYNYRGIEILLILRCVSFCC